VKLVPEGSNRGTGIQEIDFGSIKTKKTLDTRFRGYDGWSETAFLAGALTLFLKGSL